MRIDKIYINDFKNLKNFSIDLDEKQLTNVFIGKNGAGKSNLMEALVIIFRDLDLKVKTSFSYKIKYFCRGNEVIIENNINENQISFFINRTKISNKLFYAQDAGVYCYLPKHLFAYYSGPSNRLEKHFEKHQKKFYKDLLDGNDQALRPLFYARMVHSHFVLLAFFSFYEKNSRKFLKDYMDIERVESVLFVMKKPSWAKGKQIKKHEFWNARGVVREFLDNLYEYALAPLSEVISVDDGFSTKKQEVIYLYIKDQLQLINFAEKYVSNTEFFKFLESTYLSDLINEIRIRVQKTDGTIITFNELSEGEQQLLTVLGLLKFTKNEESLFLLDEPDTHLNPAWKFDYLNLIKDIVGQNQNSHVIISTHDPIVIGGMKKEAVSIFSKETEGISTKTPEFDPKGMGVAGLLTSELFGLPSTLDPVTQKQLHRKRQLIYKELRSEEEELELNQLEEELGDMDYTKTIRDPMYEKFVRSLFSRPEYQQKELTNEDISDMEKLTDEVLAKILEEENE